MNIITGGVTAPKGFKAAGIHCGVKDNFTTPVPEKKDLAMVLSDVPCAAAGTYTRNVVKADPVILTKEYLADHKAQGIILDSGNANACAPKGMENAKRMAAAAAAATGLAPQDFAVCSTGIIGVELNITAIEAGVPTLVAALADTEQASNDAAHAILTTDLKIKEIAVTTEIGGKTVTVGAIAKGSGMIHPNMGTMLCAVTTDCAIDGAVLQDMLRHIVTKTFNRITVDGDTSTNDTCVVLANVAGDGDDLRVVIILFQPGDDDGSIQAAGICKYNFFDLIFVHRHDHKPPESICCVFLIAERIARFPQNCKQILHNHPNILRKNPVWFPQK